MPEAAVNEEGEPVLPKHEIRLAWQGGMATPTGDAIGAEQFGERDFRLLVTATANSGHYRRALLFCENVGHSKLLHRQHIGEGDSEWLRALPPCPFAVEACVIPVPAGVGLVRLDVIHRIDGVQFGV